MAYFINGEEVSSDISKFELCQGTNDEEIDFFMLESVLPCQSQNAKQGIKQNKP